MQIQNKKFEGIYTLEVTPIGLGELNKTFFEGAFITIVPTLDARGVIKTALTETTQVKNDKGQLEVVKGTREQLETLLNLKPKDLAPGMPGMPSQYWLDYSYKISRDKIVFDSDNPIDYLNLCVLSEHPWIDFNNSSRPNTKAKLYSQKDIIEAEHSKVTTAKEAYKELVKLSIDDQRLMLEYCYNQNTSDMTSESIENQLYNEMSNGPRKFIGYCNNKVAMAVYRAISKNTITSDHRGLVFDDVVIGTNIDGVVSYFEDEENKEKLAKLMIVK